MGVDITPLVGEISNQIINISDSSGLVTAVKIVWDIPYIVKSLIMLLTLKYLYVWITEFIKMWIGRKG